MVAFGANGHQVRAYQGQPMGTTKPRQKKLYEKKTDAVLKDYEPATSIALPDSNNVEGS